MPTSSVAPTGVYKPVLVPDQNYNRSKYQKSQPVQISKDLTDLPQLASTKRTTNAIPCGKILLVAMLLIGIAAGVSLPAIVVSQVLNSATTQTVDTTTLTTAPSTTVISSISTNVSSTLTTAATSTNATTTGPTTSACPINNCTYSTSYTLVSSGYYGTEHININCSQSLSNFTAMIAVQRRVNATFANQYNTFWSGTIQQTYVNMSTQIIYLWTTIASQTIAGSGFPYYVEAQFSLFGTNQTVSNDTYTIFAQSACNGQQLIFSGHF